MTNLNEKVTGVKLSKACSIKPDKDSTESKTITLEVRFDGVNLEDVFAKALSSTVIVWQNGVGRKSFDTLKNNQTVKVDFKAPASKPQIDSAEAEAMKLSQMNEDQQKAYIAELIAKAKAMKA